MTEQEALWLKAFALGLTHSQVLARKDFSVEEAAKIEAVITRREKGEPLQYIMGEADFWGRDFRVGQGVLIPRHDTETLIEAVIRHIPRDEEFTFIDWGTGSGCIAITLLMEYPNAFAYMLENSPQAARYARMNLERYGLTSRAKLVASAETLPPCKLLVSNPPYIPSAEIDGLIKDVRDYEPHTALDGGKDGLDCYREIFPLAERLRCELVVLEAGEHSLKTLCDNFRVIDEVLDGGNFPRGLTFRRRIIHEDA